ncbi:Sip1-related alpha-galactosidase [Phocaeicola sp.]
MKNRALPICILICCTTICPKSFGQIDYMYEKGKSFKDTNALLMADTVDLTSISSPIPYEKSVPEQTQTIAYPVRLPEYVRGIFFSRDSRSGDFEWPNNTNRLLPWVFNDLKELTDVHYPGIPSNAAPSTLGDALLLELSNGEYLFAKAVTGSNSLSWLQVNTNGSITLYVSTLGKDYLKSRVPLLLIHQGKSIYSTIRQAYKALMKNTEISDLKSRTTKEYFEAFRYLGWCTWEHYHYDIDESKIVSDMEAIESSGIPIRYVLIDDGHLANKDRQLTSFTPDRQRFPAGWKNIMSRKKDNKIKWIGLWYSLSGYWMGLSPENEFPQTIRQTLYRHNTCLLPGKDSVHIRTFYHYYVSTLKEYGFDFLKVDNQAFTLPLYMGSNESIRQATDCNRSLEAETHQQNMGLMNCMAQNVVNTDHTLYSNSTRVSIDYKKYDEDMAKSHLFQSYTNTLLLGQTVWPDHDMFHSSDSICGALMARSKAISGGPVYLSDSPEDFIKANIFPLIDEQGKLFRPEAPAVPMPESILTNPLWSGKAYRVAAPVGNDAMALICYNLNVSPHYQCVKTIIRKEDYTLRNSFEQASPNHKERVLLYNWESQDAKELSDSSTFELTGFTDRLFHLCPIRKGWAVIGIQEKYLSPATVQIRSLTDNRLELNVLCTGTLKVWIEKAGKQELRNISIDRPKKIVIEK